jgi:hypothetical protein
MAHGDAAFFEMPRNCLARSSQALRSVNSTKLTMGGCPCPFTVSSTSSSTGLSIGGVP